MIDSFRGSPNIISKMTGSRISANCGRLNISSLGTVDGWFYSISSPQRAPSSQRQCYRNFASLACFAVRCYRIYHSQPELKFYILTVGGSYTLHPQTVQPRRQGRCLCLGRLKAISRMITRNILLYIISKPILWYHDVNRCKCL